MSTYGIDIYRLYEAHLFKFDEPTKTPTNIEATWREKYQWKPPSELRQEKKEA